ncbi:MAG: TolC family protein [Methylococcaceae bacterium]|nr:TolC family protein [Methylococcaceae bacterium]MDZ4157961.1 TolC family protein [Methylococcales bacterium]MDP2393549.1 TolC family protein [Methylococcaceae bacterium]MDP3020781.1 TolC family protein [Methylococcaceae bacterium]MDP3390610.1 TolC family protein [Methylococcaceae bacterium]
MSSPLKILGFAILLSGSLVVSANPAPQQKLALADCIRIALEKHQSLNVSEASVAMAEAQYQQAMSAYWPRIAAEVNASRADQDRTFKMQGQFDLPPALGGAVASLAQGQGLPPAQVQAIQQGLAQPVPINMDIKLFDRDMVTSSLNLTYPIFTGMKREAIVGQAEKGVKIAEEGRRKTNLEIVRDVKKYYYAAQFAIQMEQLADDTLERFKALEDLTERLYQHGSMRVKKTDYLRTKTTTAITRTMRSEAQYARELAHEALGNAMGQEWDASYSLAEAVDASPLSGELKQLVDSAHTFNPDIQQLKLAVQISDDQITEARSGYYPMIGFQAEVHDIQTDYKSGLTNAVNRDGWTIGIGMQWNLFDGFQTTGKVNQAKAQQRKLESQQVLLDQGIALQVKQQFLSIKSASTQTKDSQEAVGYASENRKLHVRAYQDELVETKDVIEAQIVETFAQGTHYRSRYALEMGLLSLEYLLGSNVGELNQTR